MLGQKPAIKVHDGNVVLVPLEPLLAAWCSNVDRDELGLGSEKGWRLRPRQAKEYKRHCLAVMHWLCEPLVSWHPRIWPATIITALRLRLQP